MNAVHAKRLLRLADFLDELPRQKFDFNVIVRENGKPMLEALKAGKTQCGTVACAIGWAPVVFPRLVEWKVMSGLFGPKKVVLPRGRRAPTTRTAMLLTAAKLFGLGEDDTDKLFVPESGRRGRLSDNATPKRVAKHIRAFAARYAEVGERRND